MGTLETGEYLAFRCHVLSELGRVWESWEEYDNPDIWRVFEAVDGKERVWDRVEVYFDTLDRRLRKETPLR